MKLEVEINLSIPFNEEQVKAFNELFDESETLEEYIADQLKQMLTVSRDITNEDIKSITVKLIDQ